MLDLELLGEKVVEDLKQDLELFRNNVLVQ